MKENLKSCLEGNAFSRSHKTRSPGREVTLPTQQAQEEELGGAVANLEMGTPRKGEIHIWR